MSSRPWFLLCLLLALFSYTSAQDCTGPSSCVSCVATQGCGWCENTEECLPGDIQGPGGNPANCTDWQFEICLPEECASLTGLGCEKCNRDPFCGWCESTQTCVFGDHNGPIIFQQPNPTGQQNSNCSDYFFTTCPNLATPSISPNLFIPYLEATRRPKPSPLASRSPRVKVPRARVPKAVQPAPITIINPATPPFPQPIQPQPQIQYPQPIPPPPFYQPQPQIVQQPPPYYPQAAVLPQPALAVPNPPAIARVVPPKPVAIPQFPNVPLSAYPAPRLLPAEAHQINPRVHPAKAPSKPSHPKPKSHPSKPKSKPKTQKKHPPPPSHHKKTQHKKHKNPPPPSHHHNKGHKKHHTGNAPPPRHAFVSSAAFFLAPQVWTWGMATMFAVLLPILSSYLF